MTSPETSEAEISAAKPSVCLAHRSGLLCRPDEMKICVVCTEWTRAALTAAAQVREKALGNSDVTEFEQAQSEAYIAAVYAMNRYRNAFEGRPVRDMTEAECAWRTAHERLERMVGYKPRSSEPAALGIRKGE